MNKKELKQKINEEQYKFLRDFFNKVIWFLITILVVNFNTFKEGGFTTPAIVFTVIVILFWGAAWISINKQHNRWMESIGGKGWKKYL